MEINQQKLEKSQVKITVTLPWSDVEKYQEQGAQELAKKVKIEGFRPGKQLILLLIKLWWKPLKRLCLKTKLSVNLRLILIN
jgi:hypothetical protein